MQCLSNCSKLNFNMDFEARDFEMSRTLATSMSRFQYVNEICSSTYSSIASLFWNFKTMLDLKHPLNLLLLILLFWVNLIQNKPFMSWAVSGFGGFRVYIILRSAAYRKGFCLVMRVGIYSGSFRCLNVFRFYRGSLLCGVSVIGMGWSGDYHNCCGARRKRCVSPRGEARQVLRTCRFSRKAAACTSCFPK